VLSFEIHRTAPPSYLLKRCGFRFDRYVMMLDNPSLLEQGGDL
jgi:hypothetical protein